MSEYSAERVLPATARRRQLAREEGRVAKSHDVPAAIVLLAGLVFLLYFGGTLVQAFSDFARQQFGSDVSLVADPAAAIQSWRAMMLDFGRVVAPILGVLFAAALIGNLAQTGFLFLPGRVALDPSRINPATGLGRLCTTANVARITLAVLKVMAIAGVAGWIVWNDRQRLLALGALPAGAAMTALVKLALAICLKIAGALLVLSLADYAYQRWSYERSLRMTADEMREEVRNQQGDPTLAKRRGQLQRELALARLQSAASKADLVIAHEGSLAVALRFDPRTMSAPVVQAKGSAEAAQQICAAAREHGIPIRQQGTVASALCRTTAVGQAIAADHYDAVAKLWREP
jgi:flagellar biosynthetic protein FlhB